MTGKGVAASGSEPESRALVAEGYPGRSEGETSPSLLLNLFL